MNYHRVFALLLCACLLLSLLAGCTKDTETETLMPTEPETDYASLYTTAAVARSEQNALVMQLIIDEKRTVGSTTLSEQISRTASFQNYGDDDMIAVISDNVLLNPMSYPYELIYSGGKVYADLGDTKFWSENTAEDFLSDQVPPILLTVDRYASVDGTKTARDTVELSFTGASEAEPWAMPEDGEFIEGSGTATLDAAGNLSTASYKITYRYGGSTIFTSYQCNYKTPASLDLSQKLPADDSGYTALGDFRAAVVLLRAYHSLLMADVISASGTETLFSSVTGTAAITRFQRHIYAGDNGLSAAFEAEYDEYDYSDNSQSTTEITESYLDGKYTFSQDGEEETADVDPDQLLQYYKTDLVEYFITPVLMGGAEVKDIGNYYLIEFTGTDECGEAFKAFAANQMMIDVEKLDEYADSYETADMSGYLGVEKYTHLPTSYSISYEGFHTAEEGKLALTFHADMEISLCDPDTYEEITGEPLPDSEVDEKPTPLFYEVTGDNGEKLYLFGTIHVGDDRTAYLPQCIYDAFDAADALAVEFDSDAFFADVDQSEELQQSLAEAYYYTDGTTIEAHLDEDLYEAAVAVMKTAGQYTQYSDRLHASIWSSMVDNFYLSQGRKLTSSKGVDDRLMRRARAQEKEILNVESGEFQLQMMGSYSDDVQEMMLAESVGSTRNQHLRGTYRLYDSWCRGDEAELIERVAAMSEEERAEIDPEELAVYDEYHQTMEVDRNRSMLEVAKGYLTSGKTVFMAVGLAHLLGEEGLVDALRAAGYTVTLVDTKQG